MARCLREARKGGKSCHGQLDETRGCFKQVLWLGLRWHRSSGNLRQKKGFEDSCMQHKSGYCRVCVGDISAMSLECNIMEMAMFA